MSKRKRGIPTRCAKCGHPVMIGGGQAALEENPSYRPAAGTIDGPVYCEPCWEKMEAEMFPNERQIVEQAHGEEMDDAYGPCD